MQTATQMSTTASSNKAVWTGRVFSTLVILFLVMDGVMKFFNLKPVADAFAQLGWSMQLAIPVGTILLICTALYAIPKTSALGAILLTGYLGGAVATHVRVGNPLFSHVLFPVYLALFLWGGLYLRDERIREVLWRKQ